VAQCRLRSENIVKGSLEYFSDQELGNRLLIN